jgi:hypothetical protein
MGERAGQCTGASTMLWARFLLAASRPVESRFAVD